MQWQMDFRKLKKGDEFSVLMSREMLDGKREQSQLLVCVYALKVKTIMPSVLPTGNSMIAMVPGWQKASCVFRRLNNSVFLQLPPAPCESGDRRVAPHKGVDFAMPQGTPVLAVVMVKWLLPSEVVQQVTTLLSVMVARTPLVICTCVSC